jgi:dual specificity tyrosine-phosphorylation-regulated kinase 2/3/4
LWFDAQVILGLPYDFKIDVWSLGCIMAELLTGKVLFQNDSVQTMLARMMGVIGDFPEHMMRDGKDVPKYFNSKGVVFERTEQGDGYVLLHPKKSSLQQRLKGADAGFLSFVEACLRLDPSKRCVPVAGGHGCR